MKRRRIKLFLMVIMVIGLSFSLVYATFNTDNSIKGKLIINYGEPIAKSNLVVLNLDIDTVYHSNIVSVQFSLDNANWFAYNPNTKVWQRGLEGTYSAFYGDFFIGETKGLVKVYVRIKDKQGQYTTIIGEITYSPQTSSNEASRVMVNEVTTNGLISKQSGNKANPFYISKDTATLNVYTQGIKSVSHSIEGEPWSAWRSVNGDNTSLNLNFDGTEGSKIVYIRSQNQFGEELEIKEIYYEVDKKAPELKLLSEYHSFIAVDGKAYFDLQLYDMQASYVDYTIEVLIPENKKAIQEGRARMLLEGKPTINTITIDKLPKGNIKLKVTAKDEAGNSTEETISIESL